MYCQSERMWWGRNRIMLSKEQMWRGHVRDCRKFKQSLKQLTEETQFPLFFLGKQRRLLCHIAGEGTVAEGAAEAPWAGLGQRGVAGSGALVGARLLSCRRNSSKHIWPWEWIMAATWLLVEKVWSRFHTVSVKFARKDWLKQEQLVAKIPSAVMTAYLTACSCHHCFPFPLFLILSFLPLTTTVESSLKLI